MAHILIMPRQGNTVESCIITNWRAEEGDSITEEAAICDVETDKASFEVPAGATGTVLKLLYEQGDDVPVLQPIAVIGKPGENWEAQLKTMLPDKTSSEAPITQNIPQTTIPQSSEPQPDNSPSSPHSPLPTPQRGIAAPLPSPRARNLAARESIPLPPEGSGPGGRIIERDVIAALRGHAPLSVAAKAAHPGAIPPEGSGIGGRVTVSDLAAATGKGDRGTHFSDGKSVIPMKGIRKLIAGRMRQSLAESAQFTLNMPAQASKLREFRSGVKSQESLAQALGISKITINDLILFAVSRTLPRFTYMNAHCSGDTITVFERVHLGMAVDTPKGLMVPVIRNADQLSLVQISSEAKRLAEACQNGTIKPDELSGSTFTVTNLGSLGVTGFTPILNIPEIAILGVCAIEMKPALPSAADTVQAAAFEPFINFSLTINHEAVDGAPAARFLGALCDAVSHIDMLLAGG